MSRHRRLGILFGLFAFAGLCAAALLSPLSPSTFFSGLPGIEDDVTDKVESVLASNGVEGAEVSVDGRDVSVLFPVGLGDQASLIRQQISDQDGVGSVSFVTDAASDVAPVPTEVPEPDDPDPTAPPEPDPTAVPDDEPAPDPTEQPAPEPTATPEVEPTAEPEPTPTPAPASPEAILAALDFSGVLFEPGTAVLTPADEAILDALAPELQNLSGVTIEVQAHTDNQGDPDVNLLLSQDRAAAVVEHLFEQGIDGPLLIPRGYGASQPIADNSTEQGRAANRRVAFVVEGN